MSDNVIEFEKPQCACCAKRLEESIALHEEVAELKIGIAWFAKRYALAADNQGG